ncbi:MAG TPA: twin-arginine translocation pathway signal protein, partial [Methylomirabilota bacterium]|nr:twin-arginine translocation pathway signal protein [Methylomirabilota bacterium]
MPKASRREFLGTAALTVPALAHSRIAFGADAPSGIQAEIQKRHAEGVKRLQDWVRQPSIAAENRGMEEGCSMMMRLAQEAGFEKVVRVPTDGQPGVFATLDAG